MELNDDGFKNARVKTVCLLRLHTATFINYQPFRCLMTKEHGLVGMYLRLVLSQRKVIYDMSKSFAESVGKGEIQAKHGSEETKTSSNY